MAKHYYVGVDVGTGSVRAALVNQNGHVENIHIINTTVSNPYPDYYEQDSDEIWKFVCKAVKEVTANMSDKSCIHGIGFDATCSLVVLDADFQPVTISKHTGLNRWNIIMWMDHRAKQQTDIINSKKHRVLKYVGGNVSLEMQSPKILWIKTQMPDTWSKAKHLFDLPDFLTMKATGQLSRSLCSLVCKWTYMWNGNDGGWDQEYFNSIGLEDLSQDNWTKIGGEALTPGSKCGSITKQAAADLGLLEGTSVGASLIDAHAGGLALLHAQSNNKNDLCNRLGLICGTSSCHMSVSVEARFVNGIWGPYHSAMVPGYWLNEGGQSATGALVDHIIKMHPAAKNCNGNNVYSWLEDILSKLAAEKDVNNIALLTKDLHIYPDFHGNRSPLADPYMAGMASGLNLDSSEKSLALQYLATIQALAYGTRHIIEQMTASGQTISSVVMCGGLSNSTLFKQMHADALGMPVGLPCEKHSVVLGAAMLGAAASEDYQDLTSAASALAGSMNIFEPNYEMKQFHENKYMVFKKMQSHQLEYKKIMNMSDQNKK